MAETSVASGEEPSTVMAVMAVMARAVRRRTGARRRSTTPPFRARAALGPTQL